MAISKARQKEEATMGAKAVCGSEAWVADFGSNEARLSPREEGEFLEMEDG